MNIDECASQDVHTVGGGETPPRVGLTSSALPEAQSTVVVESSQTWVSTRNAQTKSTASKFYKKAIPHWYALRTTYGREKKAYDYMVSNGITAFYPTVNIVKLVNGKRKVVTESRLPNIFFVHGTEEQIKTFVYDNVNLPFLRFYYHHFHSCNIKKKTPLIVPDNQMESLKIICAVEADDIIVSSREIQKFESGQLVRIAEGTFKGVIGRVARYQGQQRVAVVVGELVTVCTAYVPSVFLEKLL